MNQIHHNGHPDLLPALVYPQPALNGLLVSLLAWGSAPPPLLELRVLLRCLARLP